MSSNLNRKHYKAWHYLLPTLDRRLGDRGTWAGLDGDAVQGTHCPQCQVTLADCGDHARLQRLLDKMRMSLDGH